MLNPDFRDMLSAFLDQGVEFLVVGGYAMAAHRLPRATKDLDLWVNPTAGQRSARAAGARRLRRASTWPDRSGPDRRRHHLPGRRSPESRRCDHHGRRGAIRRRLGRARSRRRRRPPHPHHRSSSPDRQQARRRASAGSRRCRSSGIELSRDSPHRDRGRDESRDRHPNVQQKRDPESSRPDLSTGPDLEVSVVGEAVQRHF
jgi:hypothetical protein